jgi:hypothetical protein
MARGRGAHALGRQGEAVSSGGPPRDAARDLAEGQARAAQGDMAGAAAAFERALAAEPGGFEATIALAEILIAMQRLDAAEPRARAAHSLRPADPRAIRALAALLERQARYDEGLAFAESVVAAHPELGQGWLSRGDFLANLGRREEAIAAYQAALRHGDVAFDALMRIGMAYGALGRIEPALQAFGLAIELNPDAAQPRYQRGLLRLANHDFAAGWDDYEWRWRSPRFVAGSRGHVPAAMAPQLATALTEGDLEGRRVLLVGEQGVGDEIMFASIIPDLARTAASVVCVCDPRLVGLFAHSFGTVSFVAPANARIDSASIDVVVALGSLGATFRRRVQDFPGAPYLQPRREVAERWLARLGPRTRRRRIGLSWRGGTPTTHGQARSLTLEALAPILNLPDCEFVSLQYGDAAGEVDAANTRLAHPIRRFEPQEIDDFEELAGLIVGLDAVVSVQTAAVHLSGALGRTTLVMTPHIPTWRYGVRGETMPWYRSVRLFRQATPQAWPPVIAAVADALQALA